MRTTHITRRAGLVGLVIGVALLTAACVQTTGPIGPFTYSPPLGPEWNGYYGAAHHTYPAIDIPVPTGTWVKAAAAGTVIKAPVGGSCGNGVIVDGHDGVRYTYCHGSYPLIKAGDWVNAGSPIMVSGNTGNSTGPHLHLQMALNRGSGPLVCPQIALQAFASGVGVNPYTLPTGGCTY